MLVQYILLKDAHFLSRMRVEIPVDEIAAEFCKRVNDKLSNSDEKVHDTELLLTDVADYQSPHSAASSA